LIQSLEPFEDGITSLWEAGARNFLLINFLDISLTPEARAYGTATDQAAKQYVFTAKCLLQTQIPDYGFAFGVDVMLIE
jgi:phospholipase/lecithinase/hemolysin